jgi:hypothetical protein
VKAVCDMTQAELGAYVQSHLGANGIDVVLSGGAVVAIYTTGRYVTRDLDLVNRYSARRSAIRAVMEELRFREEERHFRHPDSDFFVEFPPGPLSIGEEEITGIVAVETETGTLRTISPTDCVKDRLAWYYHFGDRQCLSQAMLVARARPIDIVDIRRWSEGEGKLAEFEEIRHLLEEGSAADLLP